LAKQTHLLVSTFNGSPGVPQNLTVPTGVAVDDSGGKFGGEVYVAEGAPESEQSVVDCFGAGGEYLSQITGSGTVQKSFAGAGERWGLATDPANGDLYAALPGFGVVDKFETGCRGRVAGFGSEGQITAASIAPGQFGSPGTGKPLTPHSVTVDPVTSDVFVGDGGNEVVDVFDSSGKYLRQFKIKGEPASLAIDSRGNLFVVNLSAEVDVYVATTGLLNTAYGGGTGVLATGACEAVAVEAATEDVYVAVRGAGINQYDSSGRLLVNFGSSAVTGFSQLAIGRANSHVYVSNNGGYVSIFGSLVVPAEPITEPATEVRSGSAVLNGLVNPNGIAVKECYFEYEYERNGLTEAAGLKTPCAEPNAEEIPVAEGEHPVHAKIALVPDVAYHFRLVAVNSEVKPLTLKGAEQVIALPTAEADAIHTIDGEGKLSVFGVVNPNGSKVRYWFEFLTEGQFKEGAWAQAVSTPQTKTGGGLVFQGIPPLASGETYYYRLTVESEEAFRGIPEHSGARALLIRAPAPETQPGCQNEVVRTGASARLPDCRAYEQVTPSNKEGAEDDFTYGTGVVESTLGLDGEHVQLTTVSKWGRNVSGQGATTYAFTRSSQDWTMSSLSPQPQTGDVLNKPYRFYTPNLSQVMIERTWRTSSNAVSPSVEYALGPPGGPYEPVASEPNERDEHRGHWVAQSRDGSVAVIESPDHELIAGRPTGTTAPIVPRSSSGQGFDLYEYVGGHLALVNVDSHGRTIGTCGAELVQGREGGGGRGKGQGSERLAGGPVAGSLNAVSGDGSRIFFEAFPRGCPSGTEESDRTRVGGGEPKIELYMRVNGLETVDIGDYTFEGANPEGTRLLLSKNGPEGLEYFSYDTEARSPRHLFSLGGDALGEKHVLSEDGNVYYFEAVGPALSPEAPAGEDIYRYDIESGELSFVATSSSQEGNGDGGVYTNPDGRDFYFNVKLVRGVAGSGGKVTHSVEVYRYDRGENVVQCISCASPYDLEPSLLSTLMPEYGPSILRLAPLGSPASASGDYVFFDTPAALLPQDVNGELEPRHVAAGEEDFNFSFSPSSDVYEWRRLGVGGCGRVQGCLALISNGIDGSKNVLLGVDQSGQNVFFATHSQLAPSDTDNLGDVYDARIGGGFPPPMPRPTECEGDVCATPAVSPSDVTPSTFTFSGPGNPVSSGSHQSSRRNRARHARCFTGGAHSRRRVGRHGRCSVARGSGSSKARRPVRRGK
jgi:hypothetical protein